MRNATAYGTLFRLNTRELPAEVSIGLNPPSARSRCDEKKEQTNTTRARDIHLDWIRECGRGFPLRSRLLWPRAKLY